MPMPWKKSPASASAPRREKGELALSGPEGDGKVHDLQYWLDSGFLRLPPKVD
jgi:hypothetical protein